MIYINQTCDLCRKANLNNDETLVGALWNLAKVRWQLKQCPCAGGVAHSALRGGRCGVQDSGARAAPVTEDIGRVSVVSSASIIKMYGPNIK